MGFEGFNSAGEADRDKPGVQPSIFESGQKPRVQRVEVGALDKLGRALKKTLTLAGILGTLGAEAGNFDGPKDKPMVKVPKATKVKVKAPGVSTSVFEFAQKGNGHEEKAGVETKTTNLAPAVSEKKNLEPDTNMRKAYDMKFGSESGKSAYGDQNLAPDRQSSAPRSSSRPYGGGGTRFTY